MAPPTWDTYQDMSKAALEALNPRDKRDLPYARRRHSRLNFSEIPTELQIQIFKHLDIVTSVCLGLTCKKMYSIHKSLCGTVPLSLAVIRSESFLAPLFPYYDYYDVEDFRGRRRTLWGLLENWMAPKYVFNKYSDIHPRKFRVESQ